MLKTFENDLFPPELRWKYALGNVASDILIGGSKMDLLSKAMQIYPGSESAIPETKIGFLNLMLPVGCNASCPGICYIGEGKMNNFSEENFRKIIKILREFKMAGGKLLRIVGDGEPVLYPYLPELCQWCRANSIALIIFTNGIQMPDKIIKEYAEGGLYFYVKLWSENIEIQAKMTMPKPGFAYEYGDGKYGLAPKLFYQLAEADENRAGFQVMASAANESDAWKIVTGPKRELHLMSEIFIPAGKGKGRKEMAAIKNKNFPVSKECSRPPRASYMSTVNSKMQLQPAIFVSQDSVDLRSASLVDVWKSIFTRNYTFFEARYTEGCFCARKNSL